MENNKNPFWQKNNENKENNETIKEEIKEEIQEETKEEENKDAEIQEETAQNDDSKEEQENYKEQYEDLNNKYLRLAADFDNFRKRTIQEKEDLSKFACAEVLKKITTVLDTFERAQEQLQNIEDCKIVKESYEVAFKQLLETLKKIGMEEIICLGLEFNPSEHEAITQIPTDEYEPDCIACVMQKGYKIGERVIRPALVGVAKKKEDEQ